MNLVATFYAQLLISIPVLGITIILTIYVLAHYSAIVTSRERQIRTIAVFDGRTGDLTDYPEHVTQTLVRQTIDALAADGSNVKTKIVESLSSNLVSTRTILTDIAESLILSQLFRTLSNEIEHSEFLQETVLPDSVKSNLIIQGILKIKDPHTKMVLLDTFERCWILKKGTLSLSQDSRYTSPNYRQIVMKNRYITITITYNTGNLWRLSSLRKGPSSLDLGNVLIDSKYYTDAQKRLVENGLWMATFNYNVKSEMANSRVFLFLSILNIKRLSKMFLRYLSLQDYVIESIDYSPFGSLDYPDMYERDRMDHKFIMETLKMLRERLDKGKNV